MGQMEKNKVDMLNLLRFIAFLMVFLLHTKGFLQVEWNKDYACSWMLYTPAWAGCWIFFILAGYGIGAGFYLGKYKINYEGIKKYYIRRLSAVVPIYWFYILVVSIFIRPEMFIPTKDNFFKMIKLFFFNYLEDFYPTEFGLSWYITTLMRLYILAPIIYIFIKKYVKNGKETVFSILIVVLTGFIFRKMMGYHYQLYNDGIWERDIYKPFYFNLDFFIVGMLLNNFRQYKDKYNKDKIIMIFKSVSLIGVGCLILFNSYIYYASAFMGADYMNIYYYYLPSVYIIFISAYIILFDSLNRYTNKKLELRELLKNPMRIFDCFAKIQFPMYLFHASVLYCINQTYQRETWQQLSNDLKMDASIIDFNIGILITVVAFLVTMIWSIVVYNILLKNGTKNMEKNLYLITAYAERNAKKLKDIILK